MAAAWAPSVEDVTALVQGWAHVVTAGDIIPLIDMAVTEVVAEVDDFDATRVLNPSTPASEQSNLGDLARNAAALRAAYQWASGVGPEMDLEFVRSLHARYMDAVARLLRHVNRLSGRRRSVSAMRLIAYGEE